MESMTLISLMVSYTRQQKAGCWKHMATRILAVFQARARIASRVWGTCLSLPQKVIKLLHDRAFPDVHSVTGKLKSVPLLNRGPPPLYIFFRCFEYSIWLRQYELDNMFFGYDLDNIN